MTRCVILIARCLVSSITVVQALTNSLYLFIDRLELSSRKNISLLYRATCFIDSEPLEGKDFHRFRFMHVFYVYYIMKLYLHRKYSNSFVTII